MPITRALLRPSSYQDSVSLLSLTARLQEAPGIEAASAMMGTPANKALFAEAGLLTPEVEAAQTSDLCVVVRGRDQASVEAALARVEAFFHEQPHADCTPTRGGASLPAARSLEGALRRLAGANLALISVPGAFAAAEAYRALRHGLHVFLFSDNVPIEDEVALKREAAARGLLLMGPDCGTALVGGTALGFANRLPPGPVGLVGASGTGIQQVGCLLAQLGVGVSHALGTGSHDLSGEIGGSATRLALRALSDDPRTRALVWVSKPGDPRVTESLLDELGDGSKPLVAMLLGLRVRVAWQARYPRARFASTLEEAALLASAAVGGPSLLPDGEPPGGIPRLPDGSRLRGIFAGGTLAAEAAILLGEAGAGQRATIVDYGDDQYTRGRAHPMIDPTLRLEAIRSAAADPTVGGILFDVVLGYGASGDPAGALLPAIREAAEAASDRGSHLLFLASVCGAPDDPQGYDRQVAMLEAGGVLVARSSAQAARWAARALGLGVSEPLPAEPAAPPEGVRLEGAPGAGPDRSPGADEDGSAAPVRALLRDGVRAANLGLRSFAETVLATGGQATHVDWRPPAGGDPRLAQGVARIEAHAPHGPFASLAEANAAVARAMVDAQPWLVDVRPAEEVIGAFGGQKLLLHAGPPIAWDEMAGPMRGAVLGAALFEGWAADPAEAERLAAAGAVRFQPCHAADAVGPMGGITSPRMPVLVVENRAGGTGNRGYCTLNEGIGKVLRFGAYGPEVIERLRWMGDVLGPALGAALRAAGGLNLKPLAARAVAMGDEFHQRNVAASALLLRDLAPWLSATAQDTDRRTRVLRFLGETEQFFLNVAMAYAKVAADVAHRAHPYGTVVTAMARNGVRFGIRLSGTGDRWFTAPVNTPQGLYFAGFSGRDASPDVGDSAITETIGWGGVAMAAAPAVVRFVDAGSAADAVRITEQMAEICVAENPAFAVPALDFRGLPVGLDALKVVRLGLEPIINTGIAHREPGVGQIGAGIVRAPLACFAQAVEAYAATLGLVEDRA